MFTFKKHSKETGIRRIGNQYQGADIKLKGKRCGLISAPNWTSAQHTYSIRLAEVAIPTKEHPKKFNWVTLAFKAESLEEAKQFLKDNYTKIIEKYNLYFFED